MAATHPDIILRNLWMEEAKKVKTKEELLAFLDKMAKVKFNYNTTCYASSAAAIATANHFAHLTGMTGFQAGAVMWDFIQEWLYPEHQPMKLLDFDKMLYPQYEYTFQKTINKETWSWLQEKAKKNLANRTQFTHPDVLAHWRQIADGQLPFGFTIREGL